MLSVVRVVFAGAESGCKNEKYDARAIKKNKDIMRFIINSFAKRVTHVKDLRVHVPVIGLVLVYTCSWLNCYPFVQDHEFSGKNADKEFE